MYPVEYDVTQPTVRNRLLVLLRIFLLIPHLIVYYVYNLAAEFASVAQWFIILFTGKRNESIFNFVRGYLAYAARVYAYGSLLHDKFPAFGPDDPESPLRYDITYRADADRLSSILRIIFAIPAAVIAAVLGIAAYVCVTILWFALLITGHHPKGLWMFVRRVLKFINAVQSYVLLQVDEYPWPNAVGDCPPISDATS